MKTHRKVQHPAVMYLCEFCEFNTVHSNQLDKHTRNSHSEDFACDKCIFRAANIGDLTNHKHTKHATVFPCDFCTYKAFSKQDLNRHIRVMHNDKQPTILFNRTRLLFDRVWPGLFGSLEPPPPQHIKDSETSDLVSSIFVRVHKPCIKI